MKRSLAEIGIAILVLLVFGFGLKGNQEAIEAHEKAALYRDALVFSGSAVLWVSTEGYVKEWDLNAEKMFGWRRSEAVGRSIHDPEFFMPAKLCEYHKLSFKKRVENTRERKQLVNMSCWGNTKPGDRIEIFISTRMLGDSFLVVIDKVDNVQSVAYSIEE